MVEMALRENIQREDLNVVEEAEAYSQLNKKYKLSHTTIAKAVGKSRTSISNILRLLKLPKTKLKILLKKRNKNQKIKLMKLKDILVLKTLKIY